MLLDINRIKCLPNHEITHNCPLFVIKFLAESFSLQVENWNDVSNIKNVISTIHHFSKKTSTWDRSNYDIPEYKLREIACFVNPDSSSRWDQENLIKAFEHSYFYTPQIPLNPRDNFGRKTDNEIYNLDEIMIYQVCLRYNISVNYNTDLRVVQDTIYKLGNNLTPLKSTILSKLCRFPRRGLIEIANMIQKTNYEYPKNNDEAYLRSAEDFRWDTTSSNLPIQEYIELDKISNKIPFTPVDSDWRKKFSKNPQFYHIDSRYISYFDNLYSPERKRYLLYLSGFKNGINSDIITGIHPEIELKDGYTTIGLDIISDNIITRNRKILSNKYFTSTREELVKYWNNRGSLLLPNDSSKFFGEQDLLTIKRNSLGNEIIEVINNFIDKEPKIISDTSEYLKLNKEKSIILLKKIEEIGFIIRGYRYAYEDDLPVEESNYDSDKHFKDIEKKAFDEILEIIYDEKEFLENIFCIIGKNNNNTNEFKLKLSSNKDNLYNRLYNIIYDSNDMHSCIRDNSNYFLTTSWYYLNELQENNYLYYDIYKLRYIS